MYQQDNRFVCLRLFINIPCVTLITLESPSPIALSLTLYHAGTRQHVAVCCSVLQCVEVCCSVLQCVAVYCSVLKCVAVCCSVLQCIAVCCSVLQCVSETCSTLRAICVEAAVSSTVLSDAATGTAAVSANTATAPSGIRAADPSPGAVLHLAEAPNASQTLGAEGSLTGATIASANTAALPPGLSAANFPTGTTFVSAGAEADPSVAGAVSTDASLAPTGATAAPTGANLAAMLPQLHQSLTLQSLQKAPVSVATQRGHWEP